MICMIRKPVKIKQTTSWFLRLRFGPSGEDHPREVTTSRQFMLVDYWLVFTTDQWPVIESSKKWSRVFGVNWNKRFSKKMSSKKSPAHFEWISSPICRLSFPEFPCSQRTIREDQRVTNGIPSWGISVNCWVSCLRFPIQMVMGHLRK